MPNKAKPSKRSVPRKKGTLKHLNKYSAKKKLRRRKHQETFSYYILKVLKLIHPDLGISKMAMSILNCFLKDMFEKIAAEASQLRALEKLKTITSRQIQTSIKLLLNGELAKYAMYEGIRAVDRFRSSYFYK